MRNSLNDKGRLSKVPSVREGFRFWSTGRENVVFRGRRMVWDELVAGSRLADVSAS